MLNNYSKEKIPDISKFWRGISNDQRQELIYQELKKINKIEDIQIFKIYEDGQIILKIEKLIKTNERGALLLDIEEHLKKNIDKGLTIWLEPIGDKSKLRNLRSTKFQQE
jgi:hypothetical protein